MGRPRIYKQIEGKKFGRLLAIKEVERTRSSRRFLCQCQCGTEITISLNLLLSGNTKSCGCLKKDRNKSYFTTHGLSNSKLYSVWSSMKDRCFRKNDPAYKNYGARGITVCDEWLKFEIFHDWAMANGYQDDLTIERIDNDGDYCSENCTWIPKKEQPRNRRGLHLITFEGKTRTITDWAKKIGIHASSLRDRLNHGWSIKEALTTPKLR